MCRSSWKRGRSRPHGAGTRADCNLEALHIALAGGGEVGHIALARLTRLRLPENFDRPFSASSFLDLWNRWHITLSTWLKTYVYYPLLMGLMRRISSPAVEPLLGVLCFFVTFFLIGIWHGRTSEFAIYGVLLGSGAAINKFWQLLLIGRLKNKGYNALASNPIYIAFGRGLTFSWLALSHFWFWVDWQQIGKIFTGLRNLCTSLGPA